MSSSTSHFYDAYAFFCKNNDLKSNGLGLEVVSAKRMYYKAINDKSNKMDSIYLQRYGDILKSCSDNIGYICTAKTLLGSLFGKIKPDFSYLPEKSWFLEFKLKLATPLICKDDESFYIHDNPFHKDKVFKVPFYPASSWKGRLRWMVYKQWVEKGGTADERVALGLLFGDETGEEEGSKLSAYLDEHCPESKEKYRELLQARFGLENSAATDADKQRIPQHSGNLYFYPTFFNKLSREVINPHDRKKKAGKNPISIESVPQDSVGKFALLFAPINTSKEAYSDHDLYRDLHLVVSALHDILQTYGFGAKTSSGFGTVGEITQGTFQVKGVMNEIDFSGFSGLKGLPDKLEKMLKGGNADAQRSI